jgi:hypothetical protein
MTALLLANHVAGFVPPLFGIGIDTCYMYVVSALLFILIRTRLVVVVVP